ncbi:hypothetical protein Pcinc_022760 [Petrolisthes cinctipes]|uniref:Uncharacterized protein n=1 Tax=Petrolisthes cinctipes TaxID=88211 RepID=A0AAE1FD56_PETCI|nr:hypothetical protein Pcinc_022760 [Petrolisthes cinctipes]
MAENKVDNDKNLNSDKLASKENQQNTKKELRDQERPASYKDSEIGERESSTDKLNTSIKKTDNSATAESRGNVTDSTSNPAEKASSSEIKSNPDISKSTEKAKGDNAGSSKATDKPARSTPTEKTDNINVSVKADVKSTDKTDKSKPLMDKTDNEKTTDKTGSSKPSSKSSDKADDKKPSDTTGSKPSNDSDTKIKTGAVQETMDNVNNKTSDSNDTTTKALDLSSSQETKLPDNGLTPKDIKAVLAQEEEYDGLNLNSSDATGRSQFRDRVMQYMNPIGNMMLRSKLQ